MRDAGIMKNRKGKRNPKTCPHDAIRVVYNHYDQNDQPAQDAKPILLVCEDCGRWERTEREDA